MKRFFCLCLSPALDATVRLPRRPACDGEILAVPADEEVPGGKALNVARWLALRGAETALGGLLGEDGAAPFERELRRLGVRDAMRRVPGPTRRNEMFVAPGGAAFKVNRPAFPGLRPPSGADPFGLAAAARAGATIVLSGSLPADFPADFYAGLVRAAKTAGARVALDTSGPALAAGVAAGPDLVKPNAEECEALVGFVPRTPAECRRATAALRALGAGSVVLSDGARGAWFDDVFVPAPRVDVLDATAAGDTLLAEYLVSGNPHLAVAAGSAACTRPGGAPPPWALVRRLAGE